MQKWTDDTDRASLAHEDGVVVAVPLSAWEGCA
jgi:hypothetical protein